MVLAVTEAELLLAWLLKKVPALAMARHMKTFLKETFILFARLA